MPIAANSAKGGASRSAAKSVAKPAPKTAPKTAPKPAPKAAKAASAKPAAKPAPKSAPKSASPVTAKPAVSSPTAARRSRMPKIDPDQRQHYVEVAAYYIAERRGFLGGCQVEDWVQAENEIDRLLMEGKLSV